jgi:hypothetical protein
VALSGCLHYTVTGESITELNSVAESARGGVVVPARRATGEAVFLRGDGFRIEHAEGDGYRVRTNNRAALIAGLSMLAGGLACATAGSVLASRPTAPGDAPGGLLWLPGGALIVAAVAVLAAATHRRAFEVPPEKVGGQFLPTPPAPDPVAEQVRLRMLLATALAGKGDCVHAVQIFEEVLLVRDVDPSVHHNLALCYARLGRWTDALREGETWQVLRPGDPRLAPMLDEARRHLPETDGCQNPEGH